ACFICKQKLHLRCVRCPAAFHIKCAPWPEAVIPLKDHPGKAICWRHPSDWRLDKKLLGLFGMYRFLFLVLPFCIFLFRKQSP
ncbi:histone-lysine N-methyltransferase ASHR3-like, partial [Trifolium medium]|nr:histone-lysine N-methyltransferase ASHR3-like [Trifolium medium]